MLLVRNRLFPNFLDDFFGNEDTSNDIETKTGFSTPAVNIKEGNNDFKIEFAAPGLNKSDFQIDLENDVLTISCKKEDKKEETADKFVRREFNYGAFCRSFSLPETADAQKISAEHNNGVLNITIPKKESTIQKAPRKIEIS